MVPALVAGACFVAGCLSPPARIQADGGASGDGGSQGAAGCTELAPLPEPVDGAAAVVLGGTLYLVGGITAGVPTAHVWKYDAAGDSWVGAADLGSPMAAPNAAVVNDHIYVLGGLDASGPVAAFMRFPGASSGWDELPGVPMGPVRGAAAVAVSGTDIYLVGGSTELTPAAAGLTAVDVFHTGSGAWTQEADYPAAVTAASAGVVGAALYVFGGLVEGQPTEHASTLQLDGSPWSPIDSMPRAGAAMASGVSQGRLVAAGGDLDSSSVSDRLMLYDPASDQWSYSSSHLCQQRAGAASAMLDGTLRVLGGSPSATAVSPRASHFAVKP